ncbi:MAG: bacteriohemerythrin [Rhodoferax sp.]|uniref:GGDEF domain-containing protein n=1 Tax=Rhodoferax sp. TaxID=50421 RepID=UPI003017889E
MDAFQWNPCFVTGLHDVDEQHHRLVDVINRFGELVMREEGATLAEMETVFAELADYAKYHFTEEENLMHSMHLDARYIEQHQKVHDKFFDEVTQLHGSVSAHNRDAAKSLLQFLTHWLAYHILGTDQFMARQFELIKSGSSPEAAYQAESESQDPATATLLRSLNGLFEQVSERNHALTQLNKTLEGRVAERTQALSEANQQLEDLANTDALTRLPNRRFALRRFAREWEAAVRLDAPLSCLMIDADGFKVINDTYGHDAGDAVLRALSAQLQHAVRTDDIVCRLGGDEFLIICANTPLKGALLLAETIRSEVAALRVPAGSGEWRGSISLGVASRTAGMHGTEDLMKEADRGLYAAKRNGRNCVATSVD